MEPMNMDSRERQLDALFGAYRAAIPDPEAGPAFMPGLWNLIDARRNFAYRLAKAFVTAAVAVSLLLGAFLVSPSHGNSLVYSATYLDVLDDNHSPDAMAYAEIHPDMGGDSINQ